MRPHSPKVQGQGWLRPTAERAQTRGLGRQASSWTPGTAARGPSSPESGSSQEPTALAGVCRAGEVVERGSRREDPSLIASHSPQLASVPLQCDPGPRSTGTGHLQEQVQSGGAAAVPRRAQGLWVQWPGPSPAGKATIAQQCCTACASGHLASTFTQVAALLGPRVRV